MSALSRKSYLPSHPHEPKSANLQDSNVYVKTATQLLQVRPSSRTGAVKEQKFVTQQPAACLYQTQTQMRSFQKAKPLVHELPSIIASNTRSKSKHNLPKRLLASSSGTSYRNDPVQSKNKTQAKMVEEVSPKNYVIRLNEGIVDKDSELRRNLDPQILQDDDFVDSQALTGLVS